MSTVFLPKKRKSLYHRIQIPRQLRPYFDGRAEIWRSLKTADKEDARAKIAHWQSRAQRVFTAFKKHGDHMTQDEREALVAHWLEAELEEAEDYRALNGPVIPGGSAALLNDTCEEYGEDLAACDYHRIEHEAVDLLKAAGITLDRGGNDFKRMCRRLLQAKIEYLRIEADRWEGKYTNNHVQQRPAAGLIDTNLH